jgi:hypothetical protein
VDESPPFCIHVLSTSIIALLFAKMHDPDWLTSSSVMSKSLINENWCTLSLWKKPSHLRFSGRASAKKSIKLSICHHLCVFGALLHQTWKILECGFILFWG